MALMMMILRKMIKNRWLQLSLLAGITIAVALVGSMPVYTDAILQRMLLKDLERVQLETGQYPGMLHVRAALPKNIPQEDALRRFGDVDQYMRDHISDFSLPVQSFVEKVSSFRYSLAPTDPTKVDASVGRTVSIAAMSDLEEHIRLTDGRMPAAEPVDGTIEALVSSRDLVNLKMVVGNEFGIQDGDKTVRVKLVGVFERQEDAGLYWISGGDIGEKDLFVNYGLFEREFVGAQKWQVYSREWTVALDYSKMKFERIDRFIRAYRAMESDAGRHVDRPSDYSLDAAMMDTLESYDQKKHALILLLWSLYVPMLALLGFYLYMVEHLMIERQKNEISVLRSRGASRWQIVLGYAAESLILGLLALGIGPPLGVLMTKILGASNGFLEFVNRASLDAHLNAQSWRYAVATVLISVVMTLIPAAKAALATIVGHKQSLARRQRQTLSHKLFIDVILILISVYEIYSLKQRLKSVRSLGLHATDFFVDPLLFIVPSLFIVGAGLFILRVYPWVIRFIYRVGRKRWSAAMYASLLQISRSIATYQFVMIFLIMTLATGLFSASAARTINRNMEDQIQYKTGADMVLTTAWESDASPAAFGRPGNSPQSGPSAAGNTVRYTEPDFSVYAKLDGVEHAAKVFRKAHASLAVNRNTADAVLMGVDTDDFGYTAWLRDGVLDYPFYDYLNLIASDPSAVLISRSVADSLQVKAGDRISIGWDGARNALFNVYAIVDYWPSWNPNPGRSADDADAPQGPQRGRPMLVVGNLWYIQQHIGLEPYEVWLKIDPAWSSGQIYDELRERNIPVTSLSDQRQEIIQSKNDPYRLAINGVMTLGFMMSILICFFGFLLYWILTLSGRVLQFGIYRALGMSLREVVGLLCVEQLFTSGAAMIAGVVTGILASRWFVPFFQLSLNSEEQALPFKVVVHFGDQLHLYVIMCAMIAVALLILGLFLSRIRIHQALKLGED